MENTNLEIMQQIQMLMEQSQDSYFTEYLQMLKNKLQDGSITVEYAMSEVSRTYSLYQKRMGQIQSINETEINHMMQPANTEKKNAEYVIGAVVLSVVGALFLLTAFVMLGMTYMNGLIKGLFLYAIALVVLLFSELVIRKKLPRLSIGITGMAIGGLYLATVINYIYLNNFSGLAAMLTATLISVGTVVFARKKDSGIISIISFCGLYISLLPLTYTVFFHNDNTSELNPVLINQQDLTVKFLIFAGIILMVNFMTVFLPVKKMQSAVHITQLAVNSVFTIIFSALLAEKIDRLYLMLFAVSIFLVQGFVFNRMRKWCSIYIVAEAFILFIIFIESIGVSEQWHIHCTMGVLLAVIALFSVLWKNTGYRWLPYWFMIGISYLVYSIPHGGRFGESYSFVRMAVFILLLLSAKCLSRIKILRYSELACTCCTAFAAIYAFEQPDLTYAFCYLGAFFISVILSNNWKSLYQEIMIVLLEIFVITNFENDLLPAVLTGILFIGVVAFNQIPYCRDKQTKIYNYINLGLMACLYLELIDQKNTLTYLVMLVLGIAFIVLTFRDRYEMNFRFKNMILVVFLCYMTFVCNIPIPIIKSIIIMVIAIIAVTIGFVKKSKSVRICGLCAALVVCFKIALFDFAKSPSTEKILLFLIVGVIALAISGIYIALEKKVE